MVAFANVLKTGEHVYVAVEDTIKRETTHKLIHSGTYCRVDH